MDDFEWVKEFRIDDTIIYNKKKYLFVGFLYGAVVLVPKLKTDNNLKIVLSIEFQLALIRREAIVVSRLVKTKLSSAKIIMYKDKEYTSVGEINGLTYYTNLKATTEFESQLYCPSC